jgi:FkbM family methyltransferase
MGIERWVRKIPGTRWAYKLAYRRLRPQSELAVTVQGRIMYVDPNDEGVSARLITLGVFEPLEMNILSSFIKKGNVVADVGANIGLYTLLAADLVSPEGRVVAFEPVARNLRLLRKSIEANEYKNVTVVPMAVSNSRGTAKFVVDDQNWGSDRMAHAHESSRSIEVQTTTLDEYFSASGFAVDLLKIDAEGAELAILEGARQLLAANPDLTILTEYNPKLIQQLGYSPEEYLHKLAGLGFQFTCLDEVTQRTELLPSNAIRQFTQDLLRRPPGRDYLNLLCLRGRNAETYRPDWQRHPVSESAKSVVV